MINKRSNFKLSRYQIWLLKNLIDDEITNLADVEIDHRNEDDLLVIFQCLYDYFDDDYEVHDLYFWVDYVDEAIIYEK